MTRRRFTGGLGAAVVSAAVRGAFAQSREAADATEIARLEGEMDAVSQADFRRYLSQVPGSDPGELVAMVGRLPALARLEAAFDKVVREAKETVVDDPDSPAVWYVYNMGLVVKSRERLFSIDLHHRRAEELAPLLDFALITHNHLDHYTDRFRDAMDKGLHRSVVQNFFSNYGVRDLKRDGGYTRAASKTFRFGDVTVTTGRCDHNDYLVDYTMPFEVHIGTFTLFHSGDCSGHGKLHAVRRPDLWVVHPGCGLNLVEGCRSDNLQHPKKVVIAHLQELGHEKGWGRMSYRDGLDAKSRLEKAGFAAEMPLWGERIA